MPLRETIRLAFESLLLNKLRTLLTMLGMIIGVAAVVLLVSIGQGAKNYITTQFEGIGTNLILIQPGKTDTRSGMGPPMGSTKRRLTESDVESLEKQAVNIEAITGVMFGNGTIKTPYGSNSVQILGSNEKFPDIINIAIAQGNYFTREESEYGRRVVVLGAKVAERLFPTESALGKLVKVSESEHRVVGVLGRMGDKLGFNMDDIIFIPNRSAMRLFNEDKLFGIRAKAKSKIGLKESVQEIKEILKARHNGQEDFTVITQDGMLDTLNMILNMLTYALFGIAMISMLVGGIGIMNIMLVSVTERTKEIGIRRAVGAKKKDILKQFLTEALVLSVSGGMLGLFFSAGFTYLIYLVVPKFDMRAPLWIMIPAFALSLLTGIIFGVWPARKAASLNTIEALRFE